MTWRHFVAAVAGQVIGLLLGYGIAIGALVLLWRWTH